MANPLAAKGSLSQHSLFFLQRSGVRLIPGTLIVAGLLRVLVQLNNSLDMGPAFVPRNTSYLGMPQFFAVVVLLVIAPYCFIIWRIARSVAGESGLRRVIVEQLAGAERNAGQQRTSLLSLP